jgi:hypothetical protein
VSVAEFGWLTGTAHSSWQYVHAAVVCLHGPAIDSYPDKATLCGMLCLLLLLLGAHYRPQKERG